MKIKIKFTISELIRNGNSLEIKLDALNIWKESDGREINNISINNSTVKHALDIVKNLKIEFASEIEVRKAEALLHLKHKKIKEATNKNWFWDFIINKIECPTSNTTAKLNLDLITSTLNLKFSEFDNKLDNIDISVWDGFIKDFDGDFANNRKVLFELEDLLTKLENHYRSTGNASLENAVDNLSELRNYSEGVSMKQDLFDLRVSPGKTYSFLGLGKGDPHIFRKRINDLVKVFEEFAVWRAIGFTSMEQILKANANGFVIAPRGDGKSAVTIGERGSDGIMKFENNYLSLGSANANFIINTLRGGKYRGFPIIDPDQSSPILGWNRKSQVLFGWKCEEGNYQYTKKHIDQFRDFLQINMGSDGGETTDKRKCFGFEITDISSNGLYQGRPGCAASARKTKITYDIWAAPNLASAINLAFFGIPYVGMKNTDNNLLSLNEVEGKSKREILDIYYKEGLKSDMCGRKTYLGIANNWYPNSYDANENSRQIVDTIYGMIKRWIIILDYYEEEYRKGTVEKELAIESIKVLEDLKTKAREDEAVYEKLFVKKWADKIEEVINAFKTLLDEHPNNNKLPADILSKIRGYRVSETDTQAQKVYDEAEKMKSTDNITVTTVEKLKELVDLIKSAGQSGSVDTLVKLEKFSSAQTSSELGKSWAIAKKVLDTTGKVWVEEVLKKCQTTALVDAQTKLKSLVGSQEIYEKIIASIERDAIAIKQACEIFNWAKQSFAIKGTDETQEVKELKSNLQTAQSHNSAWNAVNNYKENSSDTEGYATKAYKKIQTFSERRQETVDKSHLAEAKNEEELNQFYQQMKESETFTGSLKETVEKKSFPRAQIIVTIRQKGDSAKQEEKTLVELIKDFVVKAEINTDFGDDSDRTNYQILKDKQENLVKYTETGTSENNIFESLPTEQQQTIIELISELSNKVEKMKKSIEEDPEINNNANKEPFYKTTSGIIIISIATVFVLSLAFLVFAKLVNKKKNN